MTDILNIKLKINISLLFAVFALYSCKKDNKPESISNNKLLDVKLSVNSFTVEPYLPLDNSGNGSTNLTTNALATNEITGPYSYKSISYIIFNSAGLAIKDTTQVEGKPGFGTFNTKLATGNYKVVFMGATNRTPGIGKAPYYFFVPPKTGSTYNSAWFYYNYYDTYNEEYHSNPHLFKDSPDTFYKQIDLVVGNSDITQNVELERLGGRLQVHIKDAIPTRASYLIISFTTKWRLDVADLQATSAEVDFKVALPDSVKGTTNFKTPERLIIFNSNKKEVKINCYDTQNKLIAFKSGTMEVVPNKTTILSGNLFGGIGNTNNTQSLNIDTVWNPTVITKSF